MNLITYLYCFFIRKAKSKRNNATLNISLLMLINLFTLLKIADYFSLSPLVIGIFRRYGAIFTILLFSLLIIINVLFRNKAELENCLNDTSEYKNDKWIYAYVGATFVVFLLATFLL
jgi:heme A synthase